MKRDSSPRLLLLILAVFVLVSLGTVLRHEMWRDELHSWLVARDNASLADVGGQVRYEKHPLAWYLILFLLTRLTSSPLSMQLFHVGLASLSAWLVLRYSPFRLGHKVLLVFGYYLFFEYNIISRNYVLGILSLFLFCVFYTRRPDKPLLWGACLFALANTSFYGLILALAAGGAAALDILKDRALRRRWLSYVSLALVLIGSFFSLLIMRPVPDSAYDQVAARHITFNPALLGQVLHLMPRSYLQVPRFTFSFWNTNILGRAASSPVVDLGLALAVSALALAMLGKSRKALVFFGLSTVAILAWSYFGSPGFVRHQGHLFIAFLGALWLAGNQGLSNREKQGEKPGRIFWQAALTGFLTVLLSAQCAAGLFAAGMDILHPFSRAKETAAFIKTHGHADLPIVGEMDYIMTPVSGYLRRRVYFPRGERIGSYVRFDMRRFHEVKPERILTRAEQFSWRKQKDCLIILNFTLDPRWEQPGRLVKLLSTGPAIVEGETYRVYLWKYTGPN